LSAVLDASAVLAVFRNERGGGTVVEISRGAILSAVNLAEVLARLVEEGASTEQIVDDIARLEIAIRPFDAATAAEAARLRPLTKHRGLSLADRACLGLGYLQSLPVYTADRLWADLDLGIDVRLIR
jgi:ribonuclease VapC